MGEVSDAVNKHHRVYSGAGVNDKGAISIVQNCLHAFPYIWVSIVRLFICGRCLMMLNIT